MMRGLRFPTGNSSNKDSNSSSGNGATSIFAGITGSGNSIVHGSSAMERAAATAASNSQYVPGDGEDLPPGWRLVSSRTSGRDYYLHLATGSTQWDKPTEAEPKKGVEQAVPHQKPTHVTSVFTSGISRMGTGLTSMLSQANTRLQTTLQNTTVATSSALNNSSSSAAQAKLGSSQQRSSQEVDREGQMLVEIYENERLDGKLSPQDPKKYSDKHAAPGVGHDTLPEGDLPEGHEWVTEWEIDRNYTAVDRDGWTYAADFVEIVRLLHDDLSHASRHPTDAVRRRRWIRYRQSPDDAPQSPRESNEAKSLGSSSTSNTWGETSNGGPLSETSGYGYLDENDDPFHRTAQKQQSGFRVNMKFPHRGTKDNTKDYQSINLTDVMWLVNAHDVQNAPTDEIMREKTANLEEQIKEATTRSVNLEKDLRAQHDKKSKELLAQQKKFEALVAQYKKIQKENETLQLSVAAHRGTVESLRKEANEEQRALNAEMTAANQALEEKAKALATARMRYKRDNKQLAASLESAKKRLEQHKAKANEDAQDPIAKDLKMEMDKVRQLHAKLEAVRQHRLAVEEESKALFNQVVEKKADLKFKSKKKMETALKEVDEKINSLKKEQADLSKSLAQKPEGDVLRKLNARRNDIRSELGALKERRTMLLAEKRKQEGVEL